MIDIEKCSKDDLLNAIYASEKEMIAIENRLKDIDRKYRLINR